MSDEASDSDVDDQKPRKTSQNSKSNNANNKGNGKKSKKCNHCGKRGHKEKDCWDLEENASRRPTYWKPAKDKKVGSNSTSVTPKNRQTQWFKPR